MATRTRIGDVEVIAVVAPSGADDPAAFAIDDEAYTGGGRMINSRFLDGLEVDAAKDEIANRLEKAGTGRRTVKFRLRDWA